MDLPEKDLGYFQLFVFDIDGTLTGSEHTIRPFTKETLLRMRKAGFLYTLATGKSLSGTIAQANLLEVDLPLVLINGGMLQRRDGTVLHAETLPAEIVKRVVDLCAVHTCDLVMYIDDGIFYKEMTANLRPVYGHLSSGMHPVHDWRRISDRFDKVNKCLVVDTQNQKNLFMMESVFGHALDKSADVLHTSKMLLEVMPREVNKLSGLKKLTARMGIPLSKVMAFGDYDNDVEMLSGVGFGVAVANASRRAKEAADLIIEDAEMEGPAMFLASLLDRLPTSK